MDTDIYLDLLRDLAVHTMPEEEKKEMRKEVLRDLRDSRSLRPEL
jgi:hypothetical protein